MGGFLKYLHYPLSMAAVIMALSVAKASAAQPAPKLAPGKTFTVQFPEMPATYQAMAQKKDVKAQMTVYLPTNYDPARKYPLFIFLEGGSGGTGGNPGIARALTEGRDFICASMPLFKASLAAVNGPQGPRPGIVVNTADGKYMWPFFKTMLDKLEALVPNIDPAHRILGGFSNGAHATAALLDGSDGEIAQRFTAFFCGEGGGKLEHYDLLKGKAFLMLSSNAKSLPRAKEILEAAKTAGAKATLIFEDIGKHGFPEASYPAVRAWLRGLTLE